MLYDGGMPNTTAIAPATLPAFDAVKTLWITTARDVAEHLQISVSAARRQLKTLEEQGVVKSQHGTGYSDTGRQTNVTEYMLTGEYAKAAVLETIPQMVADLGPYEAYRAAKQYGITHEEYQAAKEVK
ncbi:hypothetical protein SEA_SETTECANDELA_186 [Mycobacterium phage Settecandela]|nr:hypothetical protein SEA_SETTECANDELA_186 [Mycobacterium phage Settecandela]